MKLIKLLENIEYEAVCGEIDTDISFPVVDSKNACPGCIFVCIKGCHFDGHDFIGEAVRNGASAVVISADFDYEKQKQLFGEYNTVVIRTDNTSDALCGIAAAYYGYPEKKLITIGITGTKGKTTTSYMIKGILENADIKTGIIGTLGIYDGERMINSLNTTPDALIVYEAIARMVQNGCRAVVMEVSSQALKYHRVSGLRFDYGIFTNLTPDHIGKYEHSDFEEYRECKKMLFAMSKKGIVNIDDSSSLYMMMNKGCRYITYGYREEADIRCVSSSFELIDSRPVTEFNLEGLLDMKSRLMLPGRFNVYNAMAAFAVCNDIGVSAEALSEIEHVIVPGRVQNIISDDELQVIVDYAHNEASLESLLNACLEHKPKRLVCVFGCGGDRSRSRRIGMGRVSGRLADFTIITEDNSRSEPLERILTDIKVGLAMTDGLYVEMPDRRKAIRFAVMRAKPGDLVVIAGKGHEEYQEIDGRRIPFSDALAALEAYSELRKINN